MSEEKNWGVFHGDDTFFSVFHLFSLQSIALWELIILWNILSVKAVGWDPTKMKKGNLSASCVLLELTPSISTPEASLNVKVKVLWTFWAEVA